MLTLIVTSFVIGFFIPYMARRFAKFMPATPAYAIAQILKPIKFLYDKNNKKIYLSYFWRSAMFGFIAAGVSYAFIVKYGSLHSWWHIAYVLLLLLLAEIDWRTYLLPDILTVPLLILGFLYASSGNGWVIGAESALGALLGYMLPVLVGIFMLAKSKDAFGGGDIKFLSALGAWIGVEPLLYVIAMASILMFIYTILRHKKYIAFGPGLSISAIIVALLMF